MKKYKSLLPSKKDNEARKRQHLAISMFFCKQYTNSSRYITVPNCGAKATNCDNRTGNGSSEKQKGEIRQAVFALTPKNRYAAKCTNSWTVAVMGIRANIKRIDRILRYGTAKRIKTIVNKLVTMAINLGSRIIVDCSGFSQGAVWLWAFLGVGGFIIISFLQN